MSRPRTAEKSALTITLNQGSGFEHGHFWPRCTVDKIVRPIPETQIKSDLCLYYITLGCIEKANGSLFSMLCLSEKYPVTLLRCSRSPQNWGHPGGYAATWKSVRKTAL